jgi:hypothetical protein
MLDPGFWMLAMDHFLHKGGILDQHRVFSIQRRRITPPSTAYSLLHTPYYFLFPVSKGFRQ